MWNDADRELWIQKCKAGTDELQKDKFRCKIMSKNKRNDATLNEKHYEEKSSLITHKVASIVYNDERFHKISLGFYHNLCRRIELNSFLKQSIVTNDLKVVIKGANAFPLLCKNNIEFPFSDLDIVILINPTLPTKTFDKIYLYSEQIIMQALSKHKQMLDQSLFTPSNNTNNDFLSLDEKETFKKLHIDKLNEIDTHSVFENNAIRNFCSRNSFIIEDMDNDTASLVKIEVPHFKFCERIPLLSTPIYCSVNKSLSFKSSNGIYRDFGLYRLKMNNAFTESKLKLNLIANSDETVQTKITTSTFKKHVSNDLIDITILKQNDYELFDNYNNGKFIEIDDKMNNKKITVPSLESCIYNLDKMINFYESSNTNKTDRRKENMQKLIHYLS